MNTEIANAVNAAGDKAQYDTHVKRLLAQKSILAHILVKTIDEFKGMKPENADEKYEMHRLIGALLSSELKEQEKLDIIEHEYNIPISQEFREDVRIMCNLSTGIEERATEKTSEKFILNMYKKGYTLDQIADVAETGVDEVEAIIKKNEPAMA